MGNNGGIVPDGAVEAGWMWHDRPLERIASERHAKTLAGEMENLDRQAIASGNVGLMALSDLANAHMRDMFDSALAALVYPEALGK